MPLVIWAAHDGQRCNTVKIRTSKRRTPGSRRPGYTKAMLPALLAIGGGLAAAPATALELGNIVVHSKVGQPLRASVAYALAPNEMIDTYCISMRHSGIGSDMPGISTPRVRIESGKITITSRKPIVEPMVNATLVVKCPYTPQVVREYVVLLNPEGAVPEVMEAAPTVSSATTVSASTPVTRSRPAPVESAPIAAATQYLVEPGDSLSAIAMRLQGLGADLQTTMNAIFVANPDAFIGGDPNLIQAGSLLDIPSAAGIAEATPAANDFTFSANEPSQETARNSYADDAAASFDSSSVYEGAETLEAGPVEERQPNYEFDYGSNEDLTDFAGDSDTAAVDAVEGSDTPDTYADLLPGDPVLNESIVDTGVTDESVVEESVVEDTVVEDAVEPAVASSAPEPRQIIRSPEPAEASSWNWLIWIAAGGIALFGGALLLGPRLREYFGSKPVGGPDASSSPVSEHAAPSTPTMAAPEPAMAVEEIAPVHADVDFDLSDDSPTQENPTLDADLIAGTGLGDAGDVQVNQDFGFAATTELDLELTEHAAKEEAPETDIIPPPERLPEDLIVEETASADDTEYDMSVIVDATKMPDPSEVTERDLKAIPLDETGQTPIADEYTIDQGVDVDLGALEQDYEDDFAATQALNEEIEQAAAELSAESLDQVIEPSGETSVELQLANLADLDLTATLEAQNDDLDVTAKMEADDETVEMPKKGEGNA